MNKIKNVIICGLGAIGAIFAAKITDSSENCLKVLLDESRVQKYKNEPTVLNGKEYFFDYLTPDSKNYEADLVILATKNNGLVEALENVKNFVGKDTIFLSFLNGIKSEEEITKVFGEEKVLYSYYIGHTSTRTHRTIVHDGVYKIVFGEKNNTVFSQNVKKVKNFFDKTGINYEIPEDMDYSRWWKFLVNIGYNQASAVLNANYGDFQKSEAVNDFAVKLMEEAAAIAKASGVKNTEKMIPEVLTVIKTMVPEARTSMLQDVDAKRQTEVDIFAGHVSELGKIYNIKTLYNDMFYKLIKAIDDKNYQKIDLSSDKINNDL